MLNPDIIEDFPNGLIDNVVYGFGKMVKRRHRWQDMSSHIGGIGHQSQVALVKGGFADHQDKLSFFFKGHIGGTDDQILIVGMGDTGQGFNGTGNHHHGIGQKRPRG